MGSNVTMVVTACGRNELLRDTLDSFIRVNCGGAKPDRTIIVEDGMAGMPEWLKENIHYYSANFGTVEYVKNEARMGQVYSIDRAYSLVKTDYIFHCEEDWVFQQGGDFLRQSKEILGTYPQIIQVSLRGDTGWHQLIDDPKYPGMKVCMPYWKGGWGGISWNPGLRRLSDYQRLGSYGRHLSYSATGLASEQSLSRKLLDMGYRIADLGRPIVVHTGGNQSRSAGFAPTVPKMLIAILACHEFKYSKWESGDSPSFNPGNAYNGEAYGTGIHISGENTRTAALRDTWTKDVAGFPNVDCKFFYGTPHDRPALEDEVFLSCGDSYADLPAKTIEICKYALAHDYGYVFKCDDDSLVYVDRILQEVMGSHADYAGYLNGRVATGGTGYWLSRRAFGIIANHASPANHWAEDVSVSKCLFHHNIQGVHLAGHRTGKSDHWFWPDGKFDAATLPSDASAIHAVQPDVMRQWYAHKEGK